MVETADGGISYLPKPRQSKADKPPHEQRDLGHTAEVTLPLGLIRGEEGCDRIMGEVGSRRSR